jgi:sulfite exporter TauE/SafE
MTAELSALTIAAASVGFIHTILGPDHYLPFAVLSWARNWSAAKTGLITALCGLGHVASSVILGLLGVSLGLAIGKLEFVESFRGSLAAWLLIAFGLVYTVWGLRRAYRKQPHTHDHAHMGEIQHSHEHSHFSRHIHLHDQKDGSSIAPWVLFIVLVFGPCEPLIAILMYPAAHESVFALVLVTVVFGVVTIGTMLAAVILARAGVSFLPLAAVQRFTHVIAGATISLCGLAIVFLGL